MSACRTRRGKAFVEIPLLRAGFAALSRAAADGDLDAIRGEYGELRKAIAVHQLHEDEVFFPMLDEQFDGAVRDAGLRETHVAEEERQAAFEAALASNDLAAVRSALEAWAAPFEAHLVHEEEVMMPLTQKVAPTLEGRAAAVGRILDADWRALEVDHLPYVVRTLGTTKPYGPVRMFVAALQVSAGERYTRLAPIVDRWLPGGVADMLRVHGHL